MENFLGIKDNQVIGNKDESASIKVENPEPPVSNQLETGVSPTDEANNSVQQNEPAPSAINAKEEQPQTHIKEKSVKSKMSKTSTKIDYAMLKASSNAQNINSIESILESSDNTSTTKKAKKTTKKGKFSKVNSSTSATKSTPKENKKKNILDEFNDITKEYLEDDEDLDDNSDLDEEFDDTEYDK
ncbi:hypothetical protein J6W20_04395 [bacterium]|nr:hypothetical protein [bacterium]